jgi:hypothetical protein
MRDKSTELHQQTLPQLSGSGLCYIDQKRDLISLRIIKLSFLYIISPCVVLRMRKGRPEYIVIVAKMFTTAEGLDLVLSGLGWRWCGAGLGRSSIGRCRVLYEQARWNKRSCI